MPVSDFANDPVATNLPWFESPFFPELLESSGLDPATKEMIRRYAEDGYLVIDPEIPDDILDRIVADLKDRYRPNSGPTFSDEVRIQNAWLFDGNVKRVALNPKTLDLLRVLYWREPVPFQTLNFRVGTEQRPHSDTIHFHSIPGRFMCGVWVALENMDHENGPLQYYPKSHRLPVYDLHDIKISGSWQSGPYENYARYEDFVEALIRTHKLEKVEINVKKGQALIWSANLFHGRTPILDRKRSRHSQVTHYYFENCFYFTPPPFRHVDGEGLRSPDLQHRHRPAGPAVLQRAGDPESGGVAAEVQGELEAVALLPSAAPCSTSPAST